jgi:hypothetical protein
MKLNVGVYEENKRILIFIDQKPYLSGNLMKNFMSFHPTVKDRLEKRFSENTPKIGDVFEYLNMTFLVVRKHFRSKIRPDEFSKIIFNLSPNVIYKTTKENFVEYAQIIEELKDKLPFTVQFYDVSGFNEGVYKKYEVAYGQYE